MTNNEKDLGIIIIDSYQLMEYSNLDDYQSSLEKNTRELKV